MNWSMQNRDSEGVCLVANSIFSNRQAQLGTRRTGLGTMGRWVWRSAMPASPRCPRGQDVVSSCRLVQCAKASAGKRDGTSGQKMGHASLKGALSAAAGLCLRPNAQGQPCLARVEQTQGQGQALTLWAHPLARAVDSRWTRATVCAMDRCLNGYGRRAGAPAASRAPPGIRLPSRPWHSSTALRPGTRHRTAACFAAPSRWLGHPLWLLALR